MGLSCKSKSAIAVCNSTSSNGTFLESFKFRDLETATNWFSRDNLILRTSHGHMYRGTLADGRVVAVKRPDVSQRSHDEAFDNEVRILSRLFSRRLVNLLGCSRDGRVKLLVLEYMDNGPLHENLTDFSLSWPMRVKLAVDIAKAIRALHASNPPIVHRNLRTTNVFLDRDGSARLGDFGLAKIVPELAEPPRRSNLISIPGAQLSLEPSIINDCVSSSFLQRNWVKKTVTQHL
jgi:serine/threonine protein kinase